MTIDDILATADPNNHPALRAFAAQGYGIAVYENHDFGHYDLGRHQYLSYGGPTSTFKEPPPQAPDNRSCGLGWRYVLIGTYNPQEVTHA